VNAKGNAHSQAGGATQREIGNTDIEVVRVPAGRELAAINTYRVNPNVLYAEPNFIRMIPDLYGHDSAVTVPGDFYFDEEWGLNNTGQLFQCIAWIFGEELCFYVGTPDADIDAPEAWAVSTGAAVKVAVLDTGIDYTHPDLAANYAGGKDYIFNDSSPMDDQGHGTHVAGSVAAAMSNPTGSPAADEGVVGVAPNAQILAYKVCDLNGQCNDAAIAEAIHQSILDGAKVISMSFGGPDFSQSMYDAAQAAWAAGLVVVGGAGNNSSSDLFYPAAFDNVISVGAFDEDHRRATFSNYGNWVDISAPGNVIMSTYPMVACAGATPVPGDTGCYNWLSGTSMATPHVSGAAAMVWSRPDVTSNSQVVQYLLDSADPAGVDVVRLDSWTIHGGLNLHDAMSMNFVNNAAPIANAGSDQTVVDLDGNGAQGVTLDGTASTDPDGTIVSFEWKEGGSIIATGAAPTVSLGIGTHVIILTVTDDDGATASDGVTVTIEAAVTADTVVATKAAYSSRKGELAVEATSTAAPGATLTVFDASGASPVEIGILSYNAKRNKYAGTFEMTSKPTLVLIQSSAGGSTTATVTGR
jgi:thermitase